MAMTVEHIVRVTIVGMSRAIYLPPDLIWKPAHDGLGTYVKMAKARSEINRLLGQPMAATGRNKRKLQFTSIIETLIQLRDDRVLAIADAHKRKGENIDLGIDGPGKKKERNQRSYMATNSRDL